MAIDSDVVIRVEGLGKKYTILHEKKNKHGTLRDALSHQGAALGRWLNPFTLAGQLRKAKRETSLGRAETEEDFWALKDVSFEIRRGDRVGIIGRNGAGKSTLLKILSRITEPTTGRVEIRGRVASLLEVGTGFHPELTGRENIYLNGAILGMTSREIKSKFDEIVDFSEVEKFLDTPVKRYSSGMYVRLAFAVAAHLEPEILVVDEVLAVGDANFQKKCLGKMEDVAHNNLRTIIFVSHNTAAISSLCDKAIFIANGTLAFKGSTHEAIEMYSSSSNINKFVRLGERVDRKGSGEFRFEKIVMKPTIGNLVSSGTDLLICLTVVNFRDIKIHGVVLSIGITDKNDTPLLLFRSSFTNVSFTIEPGSNVIECLIPCLPLCIGEYNLNLFSSVNNVDTIDWVNNAAVLIVESGDYFNSGINGLPQNCKILHQHSWNQVSPKIH